MKCVCPMGGDRTCPDDCFIAAWHQLPDDQRTPTRRRPIVEQLAKQRYTQEVIALQLGVDQRTVGRDLETLGMLPNVKGQGKDTLGRKRSTGRPKGRKRQERSQNNTDPAKKDEAASLFLDKGLSRDQVSAQTGLGRHEVQLAVERERGRREAEPTIKLDDLSLTAQQKLDAAIRQHKHRLDAEYNDRRTEEIRQHINNMSLPMYKKELEDLHRDITRAREKGLFTKVEFNLIWSCLSPDSRNSTSPEKLHRAFITFERARKKLLSEAEEPTLFPTLPRTLDEFLAKRKTKPGGKSKLVVR